MNIQLFAGVSILLTLGLTQRVQEKVWLEKILTLNGYDHYYHHAEHGGTHYIVTAGGGAPLYETDSIQAETKCTSMFH